MPTDSWFKCNTRIPSLLGLIVFTILPFASSFAQAQQPIFPVTTFAPAVTGTTFATGNFTGQGPELAFVTSPATINVLLTPVGTAPPAVVTTSSLNCTSVNSLVAADMNGDNILDLVVNCASSSGNSIAVLLGDGYGTFLAPTYYSVSGLQSLAQPVDLNGDGFPDIVAATTSGIAVLLNQGQAAPGQLGTPVSYTTPVPTLTPLIGDFNGDGKQDILIGSSQLAVFYGNGDGTLQSPQTITLPPTITLGSFIAADVNNDGITDIAYIGTDITLTNPTALQVLLGTSSGTFTTGSSTSLYLLTNSFSYATLAAFKSTTSSNTTDIAVTGIGTTILIGNGSGAFTTGQTFMLSGQIIPQPSSTGNTNLLVNNSAGMAVLPGNGDGTFQGIPAATTGGYAFTAIDVNGDGLTDILSLDASTHLVTQLGRGNGTFSTATPSTALVGDILAAGNFTSDSIPDVAGIISGHSASGANSSAAQDATLYLYKGNGEGTFQPNTTGIDLKVIGAQNAVTGDFNGDGNLDLIIDYVVAAGSGLVFLPGNGDGTFGTPVSFSPQTVPNEGPILVADLNKDGILDLIWNSAVYLGNGNGTFSQQPFNLIGTPLAAADLNGDGIPDVVIGTSVYAGIGDGTFQTSPFFTATLPTGATPTAAAIGDINADGYPDLLLQYTGSNGATGVAVAFGSAAGTLTPDPNTYYTGTPNSLGSSTVAVARLNNKAPALSVENTWDLLANNGGLAASLLNQSNPTPTAPSALPSRTVLTTSATSAAPNQQLTLTATVTILNPTGTVTFTSGTTTLGTATITNGVATLTYAFPTSGNYPVTAAYTGDTNNFPSSSSAVTVTIKTASQTTLTASPTTAIPNQQVSFTATVTGSNPTGNVTFTSGTTTLGTATITNGVATLTYAFPTSGNYPVTAAYAGDTNNLPSSSSAVTITVTQAASTTTLTASPSTAAPNQQVSLTATVTGYNPTGNVTFASGTTTLGTAPLASGKATLAYSFPTAGNYAVTATYVGDANNLPSASSPVTIAVIAPDYTVTSSPTSASITPGQSATTTLTVTPVGGFTGTVTFACGTLPTGATCTFSPATVTPANGAASTSTLTVTTTAPTTALLKDLTRPLQGLAWASLVLLAFTPRRTRTTSRRLRHTGLLALFLLTSLISLSGCGGGGSSPPTPPSNPGTPAGTYSINVTASSGALAHPTTFQVVVQ
jgi:Bacterial Ig-like domain (group 3)/FG-GAP-like repeat